MKEIFVYLTRSGNSFYITDRQLELADSVGFVCEGLDDLVGCYDDEAELEKQLKIMFSVYKFKTSDSYTELVPASVFKNFKNPAEDMVRYLKEKGMLD